MGKYDFDNELSLIKQEEAALNKKKRKILIKCAHQGEKSGKIKVEFIDNERGLVKCKRCGAEFSLKRIDERDLAVALRTINDAIQQIRCMADIDSDNNLIKTLGQIGYNVQEIKSLYYRVHDLYGNDNKKKKKKDRDYDSIGFFGNQSFLKSYKKNK
jgi:hypothetical protein